MIAAFLLNIRISSINIFRYPIFVFNYVSISYFPVLGTAYSVVIYRKSGGGWSSLLVDCFHSSTFLAMNGPLYFAYKYG